MKNIPTAVAIIDQYGAVEFDSIVLVTEYQKYHSRPRDSARNKFLKNESIRFWKQILIPRKIWQWYETLGYSVVEFNLVPVEVKKDSNDD